MLMDSKNEGQKQSLNKKKKRRNKEKSSNIVEITISDEDDEEVKNINPRSTKKQNSSLSSFRPQTSRNRGFGLRTETVDLITPEKGKKHQPSPLMNPNYRSRTTKPSLSINRGYSSTTSDIQKEKNDSQKRTESDENVVLTKFQELFSLVEGNLKDGADLLELRRKKDHLEGMLRGMPGRVNPQSSSIVPPPPPVPHPPPPPPPMVVIDNQQQRNSMEDNLDEMESLYGGNQTGGHVIHNIDDDDDDDEVEIFPSHGDNDSRQHPRPFSGGSQGAEVYHSQDRDDFYEQPPLRNNNSNYRDNRNQRPVNYQNFTRDQFEGSNFPWSGRLKNQISIFFGIHSYREHQEEAMNAVMGKRDVFLLLPTGGGKSLTYQGPAIISSGFSIVISPLVSLIFDQIDYLRRKGVKAAAVTGNTSQSEKNRIFADLNSREPKNKLLYVTPEKIVYNHFDNHFIRSMTRWVNDGTVKRIVIDEAHCISTWGHDFRPAYRDLRGLKNRFPNLNIMAVTATATRRVMNDICVSLGMKNRIQLIGSFNRTNLFYQVLEKRKLKDFIKDLVSWLNARRYSDKCGIVYCMSKSDCDKISQSLRDKGFTSGAYYSTLSSKERNHRKWLEGDINIIVATCAFGMGIHKNNVRFVIHHTHPKSVEEYYQESGRAGRDGKDSHCLLFYSTSDRLRVQRLMDSSSNENPREGNRKLDQMIRYCESVNECRRKVILNHFDERYTPDQCGGKCDICSPIPGSSLQSRTEEKDVTDLSKDLVRLVKSLTSYGRGRGKRKNTAGIIVDAFRGSKRNDIVKFGIDKKPGYGKGKKLKKDDVKKMLTKLRDLNLIREQMVRNKYGSFYVYNANYNSDNFVSSSRGGLRVLIRVEKRGPKVGQVEKKKKKKRKKVEPNEQLARNLKTFRTRLYKNDKKTCKNLGANDSALQIFDDPTLESLIEKQPRNFEELEKVHGMNFKSLKYLGWDLIKCIRRHRVLHHGDNKCTKQEKKEFEKKLAKKKREVVIIVDDDTSDSDSGGTSSSSTDDPLDVVERQEEERRKRREKKEKEDRERKKKEREQNRSNNNNNNNNNGNKKKKKTTMINIDSEEEEEEDVVVDETNIVAISQKMIAEQNRKLEAEDKKSEDDDDEFGGLDELFDQTDILNDSFTPSFSNNNNNEGNSSTKKKKKKKRKDVSEFTMMDHYLGSKAGESSQELLGFDACESTPKSNLSKSLSQPKTPLIPSASSTKVSTVEKKKRVKRKKKRKNRKKVKREKDDSILKKRKRSYLTTSDEDSLSSVVEGDFDEDGYEIKKSKKKKKKKKKMKRNEYKKEKKRRKIDHNNNSKDLLRTPITKTSSSINQSRRKKKKKKKKTPSKLKVINSSQKRRNSRRIDSESSDAYQ